MRQEGGQVGRQREKGGGTGEGTKGDTRGEGVRWGSGGG